MSRRAVLLSFILFFTLFLLTTLVIILMVRRCTIYPESEVNNFEEPPMPETPVVEAVLDIEEPIAEEITIIEEVPIIEEPIIEELPTEEPVVESVLEINEPTIEELPIEEPLIIVIEEEPIIEEPEIVEEPPVEEPPVEEPPIEESSFVSEVEELTAEQEIISSDKGNVELFLNGYFSDGQHIVYNYGLGYPEKLSLYGLGGQLGTYYNISDRFALGVHAGYEAFYYTDLLDYKDIKFDASFRIKVLSNKTDFFRIFVNCGVGTDFVIREDLAKAIYFLQGFGVSMDIRVIKNLRLATGCNVAATFQNGSEVSHLAGYAGLLWEME